MTLWYIIVQMGNSGKPGKAIRLGAAALYRLDKLKHKGQSYDGLITELLDLYENDAIIDHGIRSPQKTRSKDDRT